MEAKTLQQRFSLERVALLVRNRLVDEAPVVGIGAAVIFALNLLSILASHRAMFNAHSYTSFSAWLFTIAVGGIILASQAFKEMHDGKAGTEWILLPATPLEKYLAAFVDSAVVFPLAAALGATAMSALLSLIERAAGGSGGAVWLAWGSGNLKRWGEYAIAVTVVLAGSASFRKAPIVKTAGAALAYSLAISALMTIGFWIVSRDQGSALSHFSMNNGSIFINEYGSSQRAQKVLQVLFDIARYAILPAFAILFGEAKVAEKEGKDEVQ